MNSVLLHRAIRSAAEITFSRSGGSGGQNVNKVNTKVTLRIDLRNLEGLSETELARLQTVLASRITNENEIVISSDEERFQHINRERAYVRVEALITAAARLPRSRRPTKPTKASKEERLHSKRRRSGIKAGRRFKPED